MSAIPCKLLMLIFCILAGGQKLYAQGSTTLTQQQQWYRVFITYHLNDRYSFYTDYQYIPTGFMQGHFGLTRQFRHNLQGTLGYTAGLLPVPGSGSSKLQRQEHRPWAQFVFLTPLSSRFSLSHRLRYEKRFLQHTTAGLLEGGYYQSNRIRIQESLRVNFPGLTFKRVTPYIQVYEELLLNIENENTYHSFDQNRLALMLGGHYHHTRLQVGYINRYVQRNTPEKAYVNNHTFILWIFQEIDFRKRDQAE